MKAPAAFAKFMTDSVDRDVAPLPTPYVARGESKGNEGEGRGVKGSGGEGRGR